MSVINWFIEHQLILGGLIIAVLDLVMAISPNLESNGIFHAIYSFFKNLGKHDANGPS